MYVYVKLRLELRRSLIEKDDVCSRMLTYARVCARMLTYVHVWSCDAFWLLRSCLCVCVCVCVCVRGGESQREREIGWSCGVHSD